MRFWTIIVVTVVSFMLWAHFYGRQPLGNRTSIPAIKKIDGVLHDIEMDLRCKYPAVDNIFSKCM